MWLFQETNSQGEDSLLLQFRHFFMKTHWSWRLSEEIVCVCWRGGGCFFLVGNLSCTPYAVSCGEFLFHAPCYFTWRVPLTSCSFMWGVSLMLLMLCFMWGVSRTHPMLFYVGSFSHAFDAIFHVGSFSYTPHALLCGEFLSCFWCYFM